MTVIEMDNRLPAAKGWGGGGVAKGWGEDGVGEDGGLLIRQLEESLW